MMLTPGQTGYLYLFIHSGIYALKLVNETSYLSIIENSYRGTL